MANRNLEYALLAITVGFFAFLLIVPCVWAFLFFGVYIGQGVYANLGHQEFAANGVSQIEPALQMDQLFDDCRHYITYDGQETPMFTSVAYFGDRYTLKMRVPVEIQSKTLGRITGAPQYSLDEVNEVTISPSGQVRAAFSRSLNFDFAEWEKVYEANGDFAVIGFDINTKPVNNFNQFSDAGRPTN